MSSDVPPSERQEALFHQSVTAIEAHMAHSYGEVKR
ncbi:hypothetical protein BVI2075_150071 [Burkholderia vietnamiensis]|nr:hypothetical protein BVI2075_150071 [Burkholderia vietnamiensis]